MIEDVMLEAEDKMERALEAARGELAAIRTGRANKEKAKITKITKKTTLSHTLVEMVLSISGSILSKKWKGMLKRT